MQRDIEELEKVWYCTRCLSLDIRDDEKNTMYCHSCGADIHKIDICNYTRWEELYKTKYGHAQITQTSIYDDLTESYEEDTPSILTEDEALCNRMNVGEFIQRRITE